MTLETMSTGLFYLATLTCFVRAVIRTTSGLHILQLDGYKTRRYLKWIGGHLKNCFEIKEILLVGGLLILTAVYQGVWLFPVLCIAWGAFQTYLSVRRRKVEAKKPLVYTARAKRVFVLSICLLAGILTTLVIFAKGSPWRIGIFLFSELAVINLTAANILIFPLEHSINGAYLRDARKRIKTLHPKVIGITGSYGKTSTKYILHQILSQKFNTLMTPDSYNTPMGICKVIRGDLTAEHEIFIVEMGAYKRGDIRELCDLVSPEIGILTAVGPQHLERFKSIENIAKTKYELIESLPPDGLAVFNNDNEICAELADTLAKQRGESMSHSRPPYLLLRYAVERLGTDVQLTATNIQHTDKGLAFTAYAAVGMGGWAGTRHCPYNGIDRTAHSENGTPPPGEGTYDTESVEISTQLLGKHNVSNILAAMGVALACGMTLEEIREAIANVEPVAHRLQLTAGAGNVTIIDDSFNANPVGAKAALEVLAEIGHGKKVLVTPGMVELGEREYEDNKRFGLQAAEVCDLVILVGPSRTTPILSGLKAANYPSQQVIIAMNLVEVRQYLAKLLKPGDVVLFENDLPDNYNEDSSASLAEN